MTETDEREVKNQGEPNRPRKLELKKTVETGQVRQSFAHGRSKMVTVEVRKKRTYAADARGRMSEVQHALDSRDGGLFGGMVRPDGKPREGAAIGLTNQEKATRVRALQDAIKAEEDRQAIPAATSMDVATQELGAAAVATEPVELAGHAGEAPTETAVAAEAALPAEAPVDTAPDQVEADAHAAAEDRAQSGARQQPTEASRT